MKTNIIFATILSLLFSASSYASSHNGGGKDEVKKQVVNSLHQSSLEEEGVVNAKFNITDEGLLELESVESESQNLRTFVQGRLDGLILKLKDEVKEGERSYNLNILFKKEK
jgi:hypothetical protein